MPHHPTVQEKSRTTFSDLADKANQLDSQRITRVGVSRPQSDQKVGGWLLFFCISLTIFVPIATAYNLISGYEGSKQFFELYPGLQTLLVIDSLLSLGIVAFAIYAGSGLWSKRDGAVGTAKTYLLVFLGYSLLAAALPFTAGLPPEVNTFLVIAGLGELVKAFVYVAIWYSYLSRSRRVAETYGE